MKKFLLVLLILFLFFPLVSLADGRYKIKDERCGNTFTVEYSGLVPCGRCLDVVGGGANAHYPNSECKISTGNFNFGECGPLILRKYIPCTMCHFFIILNTLSNFMMLTIVPPIMVLVFSAGGISFYLAGQNPQKLSLAKKILTTAIIGFVLIYGSWFVINLILTSVGVADWTGIKEGWFRVNCEVIIK